jgi:hypothetical protein
LPRARTAPCRPFRIHRLSQPPYGWREPSPGELTAAREAALVKKISALPTYESFWNIYHRWKKSEPSLEARVRQLSCIYFYAGQDTDHDGIPDWSAVIDQRISRVLYPQDDDIDGDGSANILDPDPFRAAVKNTAPPGEVPAHLVAKEKDLQAEIYRKFGILAIDNSDVHSRQVLKDFLFLLQNGFPPRFIPGLKNLRYLYAFAGHDRKVDIAAYHWAAKSISIGGAGAFPGPGSEDHDIHILEALAHEIGHAFSLERFQPEEVRKIAEKFGSWKLLAKTGKEDLYSAAFFRPHSLYRKPGRKRAPAASIPGKNSNIVSNYALTNAHEWFAEAFSAAVMQELGEKGLLGLSWRNKLRERPENREGWVDYNNLSEGFRSWLRRRMAAANNGIIKEDP